MSKYTYAIGPRRSRTKNVYRDIHFVALEIFFGGVIRKYTFSLDMHCLVLVFIH